MTKDDIETWALQAFGTTKATGFMSLKSTVPRTCHVGKLSGNRLNSSTLRSQLLFCISAAEWSNTETSVKKLFHADQRIFVQNGDDVWDIYKGAGMDETAQPIFWKQITGLQAFLADPRNLDLDIGGGGAIAHNDVLAAIRTKPFILLAGISGTGKSRLVRQLARGCCPSGHDLGKDAEGHADAAQKPGNFEIIPVRPNWHDSTELMGYVTRITASNKPEFVIKPFVRFLAKAMVYKDVPFFLCLDEMNLAPVEQYFAEYLSAVETRKKTLNGIVSDVFVNFDLPEIDVKATVNALMKGWIDVAADGTVTEKVPNAKAVYDAIVADKGLRIPPNLVVMGTVNMDETTCSFSRKVLDRAMTFELNDVSNMYTVDEINGEGDIAFGSIDAGLAKCSWLGAKEAVYSDAGKAEVDSTTHETVAKRILDYIKAINDQLENTPFKIAYRSRDEIIIYCLERIKSGVVGLPTALDEATSMKILSRIDGDDQKLLYVGDNPAYKDKTILDALKGEIAAALRVANGGTEPTDCTVCAKKLDFMARRLDGGFTNFFV